MSCEVVNAVSHQSLFWIGEVYFSRGGVSWGGDTSVFRAVKHTTTVSAHYKLQLAWLQSVPDKYTTHVSMFPDLQIKIQDISHIFSPARFPLPGFFLHIPPVDLLQLHKTSIDEQQKNRS